MPGEVFGEGGGGRIEGGRGEAEAERQGTQYLSRSVRVTNQARSTRNWVFGPHQLMPTSVDPDVTQTAARGRT